MPPRETKHKGDGLEQEQPSAESEFGEILSPEAQEQGQQGAVNDYDDGDDGTGAGRGKDDEATALSSQVMRIGPSRFQTV